MKINMDDLNKKPRLSTINIILILLVTILIFQGVNISYNNYSNQIKEQIDTSTNQTTTDIQRLIKSIDRSDNFDKNRTEYLLNATIRGLEKTYSLIVENQGLILNSSNKSNTLITFLTDNFGAQSGYLERENFQYARANQTFDMIKQILNQTR